MTLLLFALLLAPLCIALMLHGLATHKTGE